MEEEIGAQMEQELAQGSTASECCDHSKNLTPKLRPGESAADWGWRHDKYFSVTV